MHGCLVFRDNSRAQNVLGWVFERWCCMWARRVLVQSREDAGTVPRARICPARKVVYIGNGIDLGRFELRPLPLTTGARPVVMMVSRLVAEKGCRDFFAVARALRSRARFVHVGPAEVDQRDAIGQREMDELSSAGIVEFWGPTEDVPGALAKADLLLHPSYREGIPRVPMEAAATGRPVAGYDIRGMREVVPADLGLLVPRGNKEALVDVLGSLLDDRDRLVDLGRACYEWVVANFSEDAVVERLRRVYADVADVKVPAS
jgi:glycosyltransferase involved in cell wall biosynthesis